MRMDDAIDDGPFIELSPSKRLAHSMTAVSIVAFALSAATVVIEAHHEAT